MNSTPKFLMRFARLLCVTLFLALGVRSVSAFALLGPFAPWMTAQLSYQDGVSIGGPMNIGEGYRWNVPVITYGYDQSFLDFFGTNGVAAVDSAIQMLNHLPPASQINLSSYPLNSSRFNFRARKQNLVDLKSTALSLVLEQMGLAQPTRYVYCLHDIDFVNGVPNYTVLNRNFDPFTCAPSTNVNGVACDSDIMVNWYYRIEYSNYFVLGEPGLPLLPVIYADAEVVADDPQQDVNLGCAIADSAPAGPYNSSGNFGNPGRFFSTFAFEDVGGLSYLYNSNTIALESLIPGISGVGTNTSNFVNTALRPGVEKITFQRMDYISPTQHIFPIITNQYVDSYFTNGVLQQQTLQRVITQPDILFTGKYIGLQMASRTGTSNWVNNGAPGHDGPGVIQAPVVINFNQLGPSLYVSASPDYTIIDQTNTLFGVWATFDGTTNLPIVYHSLPVTNGTQFHFFLNQYLPLPDTNLLAPAPQTHFVWNLPGLPNSIFSLQTSSDLQNWVTIGTVTNIGGTFTYCDWVQTNTPQRFFRTVPQ